MLKIEKSATIYAHGAHTTTPIDVVFWNGWKDKCARLVDMDDDAYLHYVCVEPGCVSEQGRVVPAHGSLTIVQKLSVVQGIERRREGGVEESDDRRRGAKGAKNQPQGQWQQAQAPLAAGGGGHRGHDGGSGHVGSYSFTST